MFKPATPSPDGSAVTPARLNFLHRLESLALRPAVRDYYVRWAEAWINARGNRSTHLADWQKPRGTEGFWTERSAARRARRRAEPPSQFRQAVDAARILACEVLSLPWAVTRGL
jgi:hypothetical protein